MPGLCTARQSCVVLGDRSPPGRPCLEALGRSARLGVHAPTGKASMRTKGVLQQPKLTSGSPVAGRRTFTQTVQNGSRAPRVSPVQPEVGARGTVILGCGQLHCPFDRCPGASSGPFASSRNMLRR